MAKREANPTVTQTALLIGVAVVVTLVVVKATTRNKWQKAQSRKHVSCLPYAYVESDVRSTIKDKLIDTVDPSLVAVETAVELFGEHPDGSAIAFPPGPDDPKEVQCVWALVVDLVNVVFKERKLPMESRTQSTTWVVRDRNDPGYPWTQPSLEIENNPTPGMFLDMGNEQGTWDPALGYDAMVREVLASALIMAGKNPSLASGASTTSKRLRKEMRSLIRCSEWLDKLYGQMDLDNAHAPGEEAQAWMLNDKGRGLNWDSVHADIGQQIARGKRLQRVTDLEGNGTGTEPMLMWLPAVDLDALREPVPRVRALLWSDGVPTTEPPPVIRQLGIDMGSVALPGGPGC